jgi:hypothetical protein
MPLMLRPRWPPLVECDHRHWSLPRPARIVVIVRSPRLTMIVIITGAIGVHDTMWTAGA